MIRTSRVVTSAERFTVALLEKNPNFETVQFGPLLREVFIYLKLFDLARKRSRH